MMQRRAFLALALPVALAACGADNIWASDESIRRAAYVSNEPPSITLLTVIGIPKGEGAHSALMINGSQRVIFDPAGSWNHPSIPERHDVLYGITPNFKNFYIDYHARETYDVIEQRVEVTPETAALVMRRIKDYGAVPKAMCTRATSSVLRGVPGFENLPSTWYPKKLSEAFGKLPGVTTRKITDDDDDSNHGVLLVQANGNPLEG